MTAELFTREMTRRLTDPYLRVRLHRVTAAEWASKFFTAATEHSLLLGIENGRC
jgi:hypothetical protein